MLLSQLSKKKKKIRNFSLEFEFICEIYCQMTKATPPTFPLFKFLVDEIIIAAPDHESSSIEAR